MSAPRPPRRKRESHANNLRVLFLATRDWDDPATTGGDITLWENARYLASAGHDVTFLARSYPGAAREETIDGIHVVRTGGIHWLWLRTFFSYVTKWRGRCDVVVVEGFGGSRIPRLAPLYVKEPTISEWHQVHRDLFAVQYPRWLNGPLNVLEMLTARVHRNTLVRAGTDRVRKDFIALGFKPDKVFVLPVSIREDWLTGAPTVPPTPTILWLGKLRRYKCPDHVIRAMPEVLRRVPGARLVLAIRRDDQRYEQELQALVRDLQLREHVEFRFDVSDLEKRELLRASRVLVVPSAVEGFGIVVLEANACGVPVVASSGVPEGAVRQGFNGLRYPFGDVKALADTITQVLSDDRLYAILRQNSLANVQRYAWKNVGAEFERIVMNAAVAHGQPNRVARG